MGTIADLLGYALEEPHDPDTSGITAPPVGQTRTDGSPVPTSDEVVMSAVLEETDFDPADARADLTLAGDLDIDELGRWAIAADVEHALRTTFPDAQVESWSTLDDILTAARMATAR